MSLRDRLLARPRPSVEHLLRVEDDAAAQAALEEARRMAALAALSPDPADGRKAQAAVRKAEKAVRAKYEPVTLRALPPEEFEALVAEYPPRPDTKDEIWNLATFPQACLLACVESDLTEAEWTQIMESVLSEGELTALCNAAIRVNVRAPEPRIPKG